jgi:polyhydroxyalkanoate synthesis repressor PhaR
MGRIIKRYGNRKLYDTRESRYITLDEIAGYVRDGEDVTVIENETGGDLTAVALAQIILEEERRKGGFLSVPFLRALVRDGEQAIRPLGDGLGMGAVGSLEELGGGPGFTGMEKGLVNGARPEPKPVG